MSKMKENEKSLNGVIKRLFSAVSAYLGAHPIMTVIILSYLVTFANEAMSRRSIWEAVVFLFAKPFLFLCNMLIIAVFEALALISKKKKFWMWFFTMLWLGLGITNFVLGFNRITPFAAKDFILVKTVFTIIPMYLGIVGTIAAAVVLLGVFIGLIIAYFRTKKVRPQYLRSSIILVVTSIVTAACLGCGFSFKIFPDHFPALHIAYKDYGFNLCFSIGVFDSGIRKPEKYESDIEKMVAELLEDQKEETPEETPNIIFVQLESFYDLSALKGAEFSEDFMPTFRKLKETCTSGVLTVPSIGAGTANTEFEVLSGMSLYLFGMGEYPYETILQTTPCESICFILDKYGYSSHAIHNNKGYFYSRNKAFSSLGFDTFTSYEYMQDLEFNVMEWAKDGVLLSCITDSLDSTEGPDFIQCITVQGHGQYPHTKYEGEENDPIDVISIPNGAPKYAYHSYKYLANQIKQTDDFIAALISTIQARDERTVIVFYGDHIPNIGIESNMLPEGFTAFNTEFVIWDSEGKTEKDFSCSSYQLSAAVLDFIGIDGGIMHTLHSKRYEMDDALYNLYLHMLQYDLLYGDCVSYGRNFPFERTDLKMGVKDIIITDVYSFGDNIYVKGKNFTKFSKIFVNGSQKDTEFIDPETLILSSHLDEGDKIKVIQISDYIFHISETQTHIYKEKERAA